MLKKFKRQLIVLGLLTLILLICSIFRINESLSDFFSTHISAFLITIIGTISNILPFSLFEITLITFIIFAFILLFLIIKNIFKKNLESFLKHSLDLLVYLLIITNSFISICGVAYQRSGIDLPFYEEKITSELVDETIDYYLEDYNNIVSTFEKDENGISKCPYTFNELSKIMIEECKRLNQLSSYYYDFTGRPKATWFSLLMSELHITGIDFPFTSEANVNYLLPSIDIPFTMAHEIAHLKGVMREDDANTVALYVCITSNDPYVRYSGYFRGFHRLLEIKAYTNRKEYNDIVSKMNSQIAIDIRDYNLYFQEHDLLEDISDFMNDLYLSINGEKEGTDSYIDESVTESTGKTDEEGNEIREYLSYSKYQKLLIQNYLTNKEKELRV